MIKKYGIALFFVGAGLYATAQKSNPTTFAKTITAAAVKKDLTIIAGPEMEGRNTPSKGLDKAANYIQAQFKAAGVKPGNNGLYLQPYTLAKSKQDLSTLSVNGVAHKAGEDFYPIPQTVTGDIKMEATEVVFAGFGIVDSSRNDYEGLDVKDKLVVVIAPNPKDYKGNMAGFAKYGYAIKNGAKAIALITMRYPRNAASEENYTPYDPANASNELGNTPIIVLNNSVLKSALQMDAKAVIDQTEAGTLKPTVISMKVAISLGSAKQLATVNNVVGIVEGSDKKEEYVVISAHYDHEGIKNGKIYYGADDDGSGTVGVMAMAKAFAKAKAAGKGPRRTMVFLLVSGEEKGLWGSEYYAAHPIFPLSKTSANLNIDMIGRIGDDYLNQANDNNYVYVIGDDKLSTDLTPITEKVNNAYTKMKLDRKYNDPNDPERIYYRSDHWNFAKNGVPAIFYFNGLHPDYHQPTDTVDKINFPLLAKRTQLVFYTAWEIANRAEMLKRDIELPR